MGVLRRLTGAGLQIALLLLCISNAACEELDRGSARRLQRDTVNLVGWKLLWRDEFNRFDKSKWSHQTGNGCEYNICGWGNNEHQFYTTRSSNIDVQGGKLVIKARHETGQNREELKRYCRSTCGYNAACRNSCEGVAFSSGRIRTAGKFSIGPGMKGYKTIRISARVKVSPGAGLWPALWLLPEVPQARRCSGCGRYGVWASSGEIDVFEAVNDMRSAMGTIHYGEPWPNNQHTGSNVELDPNQWHIVTLVWRRTQMEWYINGNKYGEARSGGGSRNGWFSSGAGAGPNAPFDTKFHLLINMAVGGGLTGNMPPEACAATLTQPKSMQVDWVRVYGR